MTTVPDQQPTQHDAALHYGRRGFEVFPCNPRTKAPLTTNGMKDATSDAEQIGRWWTQHPDALIGCRIPPDAVVLDIDPRHEGHTTWAELQRSYAVIMSARMHTSGRNDGGAHHWFKRPAGKLSIKKLDDWAQRNNVGQAVAGSKTGKWTCGIDILHHDHRYTILPPSPHPETGQPYLWQHRDEPDAMPDFLAELVTADPEPPPPAHNPLSVLDGTGESIADWFSRTADWNTILTGWSLVEGDGNSDGSKWKHPNATAATSATIRNGCLFVYSPNTDFPETAPGDPRGITRFRAWTTLHHGGDGSAAARAALEMRDGPRPPEPALATLIAPPDHRTRSDVNLDDEFWQARPELTHIRQAAHARLVSADAVLLAVLARVITLTPPNVVLPATVGSEASLNIIGSICDRSGGGKTAANGVARQLVPINRTDIVDPLMPSSGEGLIEAFMGMVDVEGDDGKKRQERRQVKTAAYAWVDEGQALMAQGERSGSTIMETIRSAWVGGALGQHNASDDRKRWLEEHRYRLCIIVGFQLAYAASLIADGEGGTPQRFTFMLANDGSLPDDARWPGELPFTPPPSTPILRDFGLDPVIRGEIRAKRIALVRGDIKVDPLDTHADLRRLKLAAALASLAGRDGITIEDWQLAGRMDDVSCAVRSLAVDYDRWQRSLRERATADLLASRAAVAEESLEQRAVISGAKSIARKVHGSDTPLSRRDVGRAVSGKHRKIVSLDDMISHAVERGWVVVDNDVFGPGEAVPT